MALVMIHSGVCDHLTAKEFRGKVAESITVLMAEAERELAGEVEA